MKYLVIEIQKNSNGVISNLVTTYDDIKLAESAYHTILAAACISGLPVHTAIFVTEDGYVIDSKSYKN